MGRPQTKAKLERLKYGPVYCELCGETISKDEPMSWWRVARPDGGWRKTAYCETCTSACNHAHEALAGTTGRINDRRPIQTGSYRA